MYNSWLEKPFYSDREPDVEVFDCEYCWWKRIVLRLEGQQEIIRRSKGKDVFAWSLKIKVPKINLLVEDVVFLAVSSENKENKLEDISI